MKKITLLIALFMLCQYSVKADSDALLQNHFIYVTGTSGEAGSTAELTLNIHNNNPINYWKCDLILPEGFTLKSAAPVKDRWPEEYDPIITTNANDDGSVTIFNNFNNDAEDVSLTGTDGPVATVTVDIANTVSSGKYTITLRNIYLEEPNGTIIWKEYTEFKWTIMGESIPFVEEGKVWNMYYHNDLAHETYPTYHYKYFIQGDTIIAGQNCKKFYAFNENNDNKTEYKMALYETGRRVYFFPIGSTESYLLYDFLIPVDSSVVTADPIKPEWDIEMQNNKDVIAKINGVNRHCLFVNRVNPTFEYYSSGWWIEGVGSELGPLNTWGFYLAGNFRFFWSCEINGECIYNKSQLMLANKDEYYPDGTRWTEIRLDTLKYDSWCSKVGDEWVPNFETIEYYVKGEYTDDYGDTYKCVYTNGPEWSDSLTLLIREFMYNNTIDVKVFANGNVPCAAQIYQFDWSIGKGLYYRDICESNTTSEYPYKFYYGIINEIKEGYFGGVRPLKYVDLDGKAPYIQGEPGNTDTKGGRLIQGIGITEWDDGECLFGPPNPYFALSEYDTYYWDKYPERHYRSMLVHFERDGEVLYDVWPRKESSVEVAIDGLNYYLDFNKHEAIIDRDNTWSGELDIPSEVIYEGQRFVVKSMIWCAFANCPELTRVRIPKTIESVTHHVLNGMNGAVSPDHMNPFMGCTALESVEVDEENPSFKSVDGVFFSQDGKGQYYIGPDYFNGTGLFCYPAGKQQESYIIPEGVEWIGATAFEYSQHLTTLTIPSTMICIYGSAFKGCSNLTDVYCNAENVPKTNKQAFTDCPLASATLHVPAGSVDLYKSTYPWSEFGNIVAIAQDSSPTLEDLLAEAESLLFGCSYVRSSQGTKKAVLYYSIKEKEEIEGIKYSNLFIDVVELSALQDGIHEMVFIDEKYPGEPTCTDVLLIRQDGDKVYCQTENDTQEWLILDFGLKMGDIFVNGAGERFLVKEITKSEDSKRKRILLISEDGTQEDTWEEGIGSLQWGFLPNYVVKTLKYFQDVEDSMFTNLWAAANPDYFVEQGVYDENFKLQPFDEIKDEAAEDMTLEDLPDSPLSYSFIENSLRIQGYYPLNLYPSFAAASITSGHIDISIHQVTGLNIIKGNHIAKIDVLIPGFKAGTYEVGMSGQEYVTLECKGSSAQYNDPVTFTKDLMATIILPTMPDASKGKYYRLDRCEDNQIIFEQELQPQARVPYVIVPNEDFTIDPSTLNLEGLTQDEVSIEGVSFIGSYHREELPALTGGDGEGSSYIDLIDTTSDCGITISTETGKETFLIGALRAYLIVSWDDPINPGGARSPKDKLEIVLKDFKTGVGDAPRLNDKGQMKNEKWYDLQGRQINNSNFKFQNSSQSSGAGGAKLPRGIYIKDKKKVLY